MNEETKSKASILIADDEFTVRYAVRSVLEDAGYDVQEARDGLEALSVMATTSIDVALIDIIMPKIEGTETIHQMRHDYPNVSVIAISGGGRSTNLDYLEKAQANGAHAILRKPFSNEQLLEAVQEQLG